MSWLLSLAGVGVWILYLACGLFIAKVFAAGSARVRALYWVLPVIVGGLGDLMMRAGDKVRARRVLEMALSASDIAAVKYHRGTMWFTLQRARALVLLGRTEEALEELGAFPRSGWAPDAWLLDADTVFDRLGDDERFQRIIAERHANALRERADVNTLRSQKVIPQDLRWR